MSLKISIVTPSYNQVDFVEETLRSVLNQDYPNLEYIVVDGASTDGSVEIIEKYRDRLAHFISEPDKGQGEALNRGFRLATGEIMGWLNSDDKYLPWTLQTVADIFEQFPTINWITGTSAFFNDRGALTEVVPIYKNILDYLDGNFAWIQQESVFWRRGLWERAGSRINNQYRLMVDGELWTRFFRLDSLWHVQCVLAGYRKHGGTRSGTSFDACVVEMQHAIEIMRGSMDMTKLKTAHPNEYLLLRYDEAKRQWAPRTLNRALVPRR